MAGTKLPKGILMKVHVLVSQERRDGRIVWAWGCGGAVGAEVSPDRYRHIARAEVISGACAQEITCAKCRRAYGLSKKTRTR